MSKYTKYIIVIGIISTILLSSTAVISASDNHDPRGCAVEQPTIVLTK